MNECIFVGNLTGDPELRYAPSGGEVTTFSIAINERTKDGKETTEYLDFVCWDKLAQTVAEYARKGRKVAVRAAYHLKRWEDNETGAKRSKPEFRARNVEFLDKPPQDQQRAQQQAPSQPTRSAEEDRELDDLPF